MRRQKTQHLMRLMRAALAASSLVVVACHNPCDELVDKRCECGPEVCRVARDELKLATELLRSLGGNGGREVLAARCKERLQAFSCATPAAAPTVLAPGQAPLTSPTPVVQKP